MRKIFVLFLCCFLAVTMVGCGNTSATSSDTETTTKDSAVASEDSTENSSDDVAATDITENNASTEEESAESDESDIGDVSANLSSVDYQDYLDGYVFQGDAYAKALGYDILQGAMHEMEVYYRVKNHGRYYYLLFFHGSSMVFYDEGNEFVQIGYVSSKDERHYVFNRENGPQEGDEMTKADLKARVELLQFYATADDLDPLNYMNILDVSLYIPIQIMKFEGNMGYLPNGAPDRDLDAPVTDVYVIDPDGTVRYN